MPAQDFKHVFRRPALIKRAWSTWKLARRGQDRQAHELTTIHVFGSWLDLHCELCLAEEGGKRTDPRLSEIAESTGGGMMEGWVMFGISTSTEPTAMSASHDAPALPKIRSEDAQDRSQGGEELRLTR